MLMTPPVWLGLASRRSLWASLFVGRAWRRPLRISLLTCAALTVCPPLGARPCLSTAPTLQFLYQGHAPSRTFDDRPRGGPARRAVTALPGPRTMGGRPV